MKKNITFIGDVHGNFDYLESGILPLCYDSHITIQIGDLGIGFGPEKDPEFFGNNLMLDCNFRFIRGNHDNPNACKNHKQYLGDFGYLEHLDIFFCGGAWSIDHLQRTQGINWWTDEELSLKEFSKALDLYKLTHASVVVTHDCPSIIKPKLTGINSNHYRTITDQFLQLMFEDHQPKHWIFGHWHQNKEIIEGVTKFRCVDILDTYTI